MIRPRSVIILHRHFVTVFDPYHVLGLRRDAKIEEIHAQYDDLLEQYQHRWSGKTASDIAMLTQARIMALADAKKCRTESSVAEDDRSVAAQTPQKNEAADTCAAMAQPRSDTTTAALRSGQQSSNEVDEVAVVHRMKSPFILDLKSCLTPYDVLRMPTSSSTYNSDSGAMTPLINDQHRLRLRYAQLGKQYRHARWDIRTPYNALQFVNVSIAYDALCNPQLYTERVSLLWKIRRANEVWKQATIPQGYRFSEEQYSHSTLDAPSFARLNPTQKEFWFVFCFVVALLMLALFYAYCIVQMNRERKKKQQGYMDVLRIAFTPFIAVED
jgi:hypothetical protein